MAKRKLIYGVGVYDIARPCERKVDGKRRRDPVYRVWHHMLERCYSKKYQERFPTYIGCSVCSEWLYASVFEKWLVQHANWQDLHLDKDILVPDNKVYSPDTCVLVPQELNTLLLTRNAMRGKYPLGVTWFKQHKKYGATYVKYGHAVHLGLFDCQWKAAEAYKVAKSNHVRQIAFQQQDTRLQEALYNWSILYELGLVQ